MSFPASGAGALSMEPPDRKTGCIESAAGCARNPVPSEPPHVEFRSIDASTEIQAVERQTFCQASNSGGERRKRATLPS